MSNIANKFALNRSSNLRSLMVYLNCGDPDLETTYALIEQCVKQDVDIIELGVPFPNSFTDGSTVLRSHKRALDNNIEFEDTIELVKRVRSEHSIPIVILVDFSHTVKPRGIEQVVKQSVESGVDGILCHGLPPLYQAEYITQVNKYGIAPIFSLYPNSSQEIIDQTLSNSKGFIYLVTQYGRNGAAIDFRSPEMTHFFTLIRSKTDLPLLAGFGIRNSDDMENVFSTDAVDGVIMGSAICNIIESSLQDDKDIIPNVQHYLNSIDAAKNIGYKQNLRDESEYTA